MARDRYDYDKDIIDGSGNISGAGDIDLTGNITLTAGGSIITTANGSIILLPNGTGITIIGDAGSTSHSLNTNDDLFVSGKLEVDGSLYSDGSLTVGGSINQATGSSYIQNGGSGAAYKQKNITEVVIIPVAEGNTPVVTSATNLAPADSIIKAVAVRVTQPPGGGATVVSVGRSGGGNTDEFIDDISTAAGTTGHSGANSDGSLTYAVMLNSSVDTFEITTDADVTVSDMLLRITVWYDEITPATS